MTPQEETLFRQLIQEIARIKKVIGVTDTLEMVASTYTDEQAQDAVGTILTDTTTIDFTYVDATPGIVASVKTDSIDNTLLANMAADTIKGYAGIGTGDPTDLTATQARTILNVASGADVTGTAITALAAKVTPVDADAVVITDSAAADAPKRTLWSNIKATLKAYFDPLYVQLAGVAGGQRVTGIASTGIALEAYRNLVAASTDSPVFQVYQDHASDDQPVAVFRQDGSGNIIEGYNNAGAKVMWNEQGSTYSILKTDASTLGTSAFSGFGTATDQGRIEYSAYGSALSGSHFGQTRAGAGIFRTVDLTKFLLGTFDSAPVIFGTNNTFAGAISTAQDWGIGVLAPAARLDVLQLTLGSAVQKLASTATNDDPSEIVYQNRVATTDATVTTLHTFTIPASTTYAIRATVVARRTGGVSGAAEDGAFYTLESVYKNVAGVATIIGAAVYTAKESVAGWDAVFDVTGATVRARVTGAATTSITWHVTAKVNMVST